MSEERILSLETRMNAMETRFDKVDQNLDRIWERIDQHREGQIRTQTLVEEVGKDIHDVRVQLSKVADAVTATAQTGASKWEQFFSKAFWVVTGAGIAYLTTKLK